MGIKQFCNDGRMCILIMIYATGFKDIKSFSSFAALFFGLICLLHNLPNLFE